MKSSQRIRRIIAREKIIHPNTPAPIILVNRVVHVLRYEMEKIRIRLVKNSTFTSENEMWMCSLFPKKVLDIIVGELKPRTFLDVGCGTGVSLKYLIDNGINAIGIENSKLAISKSAVPDKIIRHNLNKPLNLKRQFDLVWCFEVIEHIHPDFESVFLDILVNHSSTIVLSAARPGQGGHGHFNEQTEEYWISKFEMRGYEFLQALTFQLQATGEIHSQNILCFQKKQLKGC